MLILEDAGLLTIVDNPLPQVYICAGAPHGWQAIAAECAEHNGGTHMPMRKGVYYQHGLRFGGVIYDTEYWETVKVARGICRELVGPADIPPTLAGCMRRMLENVTPRRWPEKQAERHLIGEPDPYDDMHQFRLPFQYHDCLPGVYRKWGRTPTGGKGEAPLTQWDCSGYYFQLITRAPSLKLTVFREGLQWEKWTPNEAAKWRDLLQAVRGHKTIRNSIYGVALGSNPDKRMLAFSKDNHKWLREPLPRKQGQRRKYKETNIPNPEYGTVRAGQVPLTMGPYRPFAMLIARTGFECCCMESAACQSVYSTVDSVTTQPGYAPSVWAKYGIAYGIAKTKAGRQILGAGHIVGRGVWRIGPKTTIWYKEGRRDPAYWERAETPKHLYADDWL